ncbi:hypothetical protein GGR51DRAFT_562836 [Nemania sp. FL0031]|nr:hypothetical protein GGR51DRAFT_562836 [Nemania sp. FL0031]
MSPNTSGINNSEGFPQDSFTSARPPQYNITTQASSTVGEGHSGSGHTDSTPTVSGYEATQTSAPTSQTPGITIPNTTHGGVVGQPLTAEALADHNLANEPAEGSSRGWICGGSRLMTHDLLSLDPHHYLETSRLPRTGTMARTGCASSRATTAALGNQTEQAEHTGDNEVSGAGLRFDEPAGLRLPKIPDEDLYDMPRNA